jgi:hypothetical protein
VTLIDDALMATIDILATEARCAADTHGAPDYPAMRERIDDDFDRLTKNINLLEGAMTAAIFTVLAAVATSWWLATETRHGPHGMRQRINQLPTTNDDDWRILTTVAHIARFSNRAPVTLAMWAYIEHLNSDTFANVCLFVAAQTAGGIPPGPTTTHRDTTEEMIQTLLGQYDELRAAAEAVFHGMGYAAAPPDSALAT